MEPKTIAERAAKLGFPAIAVTDRNGLYGVMPFSDACIAKGVQPIVGALLAVARPPEIAVRQPQDERSSEVDWLVLLAKDGQGYDNLCKLVSAAHLDRPVEQEPHVGFAKLEGLNEGLIALTAGAEGALARLIADRQQPKAEAYLDRLEALFPGRLYVEISRRHDPVEDSAEAGLIDLAYARDLPHRRDQPRRLSRSVVPRRPRCDAVHRRLRLCRKCRPSDLIGGRLAQGRRGNGRAVRRFARGARQHRGDRPEMRGGRAQAQADPSAARGE